MMRGMSPLYHWENRTDIIVIRQGVSRKFEYIKQRLLL